MSNHHTLCQTCYSVLFWMILDDFKGFDGNGFFTLNHSLLTGMTGNFVTLMVILIQFKQSEVQE